MDKNRFSRYMRLDFSWKRSISFTIFSSASAIALSESCAFGAARWGSSVVLWRLEPAFWSFDCVCNFFGCNFLASSSDFSTESSWKISNITIAFAVDGILITFHSSLKWNNQCAKSRIATTFPTFETLSNTAKTKQKLICFLCLREFVLASTRNSRWNWSTATK